MNSLFNITVVVALVHWLGQLALYLSFELTTDVDKEKRFAHASLVISLIAAAVFTGAYVAWETQFGNAFRFFFPFHGAQRLTAQQWRAGIFIKTLFVSNLIIVLLAVFFTHNFAFTSAGLRVLTPITTLQLLLYNVCQNFCLLVLLLYVVAAQYYHFG
jgi:hypothetical protein